MDILVVILIGLLIYNWTKYNKRLSHSQTMTNFYLTFLKWSYKQDKVNTRKRIINYFLALKELSGYDHDKVLKEIAVSWRIKLPKDKKGEFIINDEDILEKFLKKIDEHSDYEYIKDLNAALEKTKPKQEEAHKKFLKNKVNLNLYFGKDLEGKDVYIDLEKENIHSIFLTGSTGTGKSILHYYLYKQLVENNSPKDFGFVFMDMIRVEFAGWDSPFLHLPVINKPEEAIKVLEKLSGYKGDKKIFVHIEECDMAVQYPGSFEEAWEKIHKNKNIYIIFSTSRPSVDVFTQNIRKNTDMIIAYNLFSKRDSKYVIGKSLVEKFKVYEKIICYKDKEILLKPFDKKETISICEFGNLITHLK